MRKNFRFSAFVVLFSVLTGFFYVFYIRLSDNSFGVVPYIPPPTPTPFPPTVESPLNSKIWGEWKISNVGEWEDATIAFDENGGFTIIGGLNNIDKKGSYFFTAENNIILSFSSYYRPAEVELDFQNDDQMVLLVRIPYETNDTTYIAEKIK